MTELPVFAGKSPNRLVEFPGSQTCPEVRAEEDPVSFDDELVSLAAPELSATGTVLMISETVRLIRFIVYLEFVSDALLSVGYTAEGSADTVSFWAAREEDA